MINSMSPHTGNLQGNNNNNNNIYNYSTHMNGQYNFSPGVVPQRSQTSATGNGSPCAAQADLFELANDPDMCADDQNSFCPDVDQITGLQLTFPVEPNVHVLPDHVLPDHVIPDHYSRISYSHSPTYSTPSVGRRGSPDDQLTALGNFSPSALLTPLSIDQSPLMDVQFGSQMSPCSINSTSPTPSAIHEAMMNGGGNGGVNGGRGVLTQTPAPPPTNLSVDQSDNESVSNLQVRVSVLQQRVIISYLCVL